MKHDERFLANVKASSKLGYIMIMALLMISMSTMLVTLMFNRGAVYNSFTRIMIDQEKAELLAQTGIEIFKAQLCKPYIKNAKKDSEPDKKNAPIDAETEGHKVFLEQALAVLNQWQTFPLKEAVDGVEGEIAIYISCEDSKININKSYDFEKHEFVGEKAVKGNYKTVLQELCKRLEKEIKAKDLFSALEKFLKKQSQPLEDITQLLEINEFAPFKKYLFYEKIDGLPESKQVYLFDIFTVTTNHNTLEPWLLSQGLMQLFGFMPSFKENGGQKGALKEVIKNFKKRTTWKTEWNSILKPVYQKELQSLPENIDSVLSSAFSPTTFLVVCQAKVGRAVARACAIVERTVRAKEEKQEYAILIKKLYWL